MLQEESNLYEEWHQFVGAIPYYNLDAEEQVELLCLTRDNYEPRQSYHYLRLENAYRKARDLDPDCNIFFVAAKRSATTYSDDKSKQILAYWMLRDTHPDDSFATRGISITHFQMVSGHSDLEQRGRRYYRDGRATREAGWFYYRSRWHQRRKPRN